MPPARWRRGLLTGALVCAGLMAPPAVAGAATISQSFSPPSIPLAVQPTTRGRQAVRNHHVARVTVTVGYTPKGGTLRTVRFALTV